MEDNLNMEDKLNNILQILKEKKEKYPNITTLWKDFIIVQYKQLTTTLNQCTELFSNIENNIETDIDQKTILLLYLLKYNSFFEQHDN